MIQYGIVIASAVTGGVIGATASFLGVRFGRNAYPRQAVPSYKCGCRHALALHDPETTRCHAVVEQDWDGPYRDSQCPCRQYVGDRPLTNPDEIVRLWQPPKETR